MISNLILFSTLSSFFNSKHSCWLFLLDSRNSDSKGTVAAGSAGAGGRTTTSGGAGVGGGVVSINPSIIGLIVCLGESLRRRVGCSVGLILFFLDGEVVGRKEKVVVLVVGMIVGICVVGFCVLVLIGDFDGSTVGLRVGLSVGGAVNSVVVILSCPLQLS